MLGYADKLKYINTHRPVPSLDIQTNETDLYRNTYYISSPPFPVRFGAKRKDR